MPVQIFYNISDLSAWPDQSFQSMSFWTSSGIDFARQNGASVISISWKSAPSTDITNAITSAATQGRNSLGCILVAASGNDFTNSVAYLANQDNYVIAVGATDQNDNRWAYSNYGQSLDVVAPSGNGNPLIIPVDPFDCPGPAHDILKLRGYLDSRCEWNRGI